MFSFLKRRTFETKTILFFYSACAMPRDFSPVAFVAIFSITEPEADRNSVGKDWKRERKWTNVGSSLNWEQRAHGPLFLWLLICAWSMSLLYSHLCSLLWIRSGSASVENRIGVDVCTRELKTAGEEILMIVMGNKQDIYLQADRCTWPLR